MTAVQFGNELILAKVTLDDRDDHLKSKISRDRQQYTTAATVRLLGRHSQ